jgi:hypothetical protein
MHQPIKEGNWIREYGDIFGWGGKSQRFRWRIELSKNIWLKFRESPKFVTENQKS